MQMKKCILAAALARRSASSLSAQAPRRVAALGDWPEARGPNGDGVSKETGLVEKWALNGQNFLWRAPYGGRSAPIVMGNRVYVQNPAGRGPALQERVMALDADTGKVVWEYRFNVFQSDVPPHRVAWASPAADPETGNIYALERRRPSHRAQQGRQAALGSLDRRRVRRVHHSRRPHDVADHRRQSGHRQPPRFATGARRRNRSHRLVALDKRTGDIVYLANPGGRPVRHGVRSADDRHHQRRCGC